MLQWRHWRWKGDGDGRFTRFCNVGEGGGESSNGGHIPFKHVTSTPLPLPRGCVSRWRRCIGLGKRPSTTTAAQFTGCWLERVEGGIITPCIIMAKLMVGKGKT